MSNMTKTSEIYVRGHETATHTVTYWHGQITVCTPTGQEDGSWWESHLRCTHDHETRDAAQNCEDRMTHLARRHGSELPDHVGWVVQR